VPEHRGQLRLWSLLLQPPLPRLSLLPRTTRDWIQARAIPFRRLRMTRWALLTGRALAVRAWLRPGLGKEPAPAWPQAEAPGPGGTSEPGALTLSRGPWATRASPRQETPRRTGLTELAQPNQKRILPRPLAGAAEESRAAGHEPTRARTGQRARWRLARWRRWALFRIRPRPPGTGQLPGTDRPRGTGQPRGTGRPWGRW
jgi:hypothetical protein